MKKQRMHCYFRKQWHLTLITKLTRLNVCRDLFPKRSCEMPSYLNIGDGLYVSTHLIVLALTLIASLAVDEL